MGKRIAIVGAGAVGGYVGAHLARTGANVLLIDPWPEHVETMRRRGLSVEGMTQGENFTVPVRALHLTEVQSLTREKAVDIAIVSVKSYDTEWAAAFIRPYLAPDGFVVSMQNSINEECIAGIVGWGRTVGCIVSMLGAELVEPARVVRASPRGDDGHVGLRAGEPHGRITPRLEELVRLIECADSAKATTNLWGERWSKLVINSMRNGVSAMTGMSGQERDLDGEVRNLTIRLGGQCIRVGQALGYRLEPTGGIDLDLLAAATDGDAKAYETLSQQIVRVARSRSERQRPSMGQDVQKGRRSETDFINGLVARKGVEAGIDASLHARVDAIMRQIDAGKLKPGRELARGL